MKTFEIPELRLLPTMITQIRTKRSLTNHERRLVSLMNFRAVYLIINWFALQGTKSGYPFLAGVLLGCIALLAATLTLLLPETLKIRLPDTIEEAESLGKKQEEEDERKHHTGHQNPSFAADEDNGNVTTHL